MRSNAQHMIAKLEEVARMMRQTSASKERVRVRESSSSRRTLDEEDVQMYESMKQPYCITEVKKRRGVSHHWLL